MARLRAWVALGLAACSAVSPRVADPGDRGGMIFESDWSTAIGASHNAVTDDGRWGNYWEFDNGTGVQVLSVVPGGPGGRNALMVIQRGENAAATVQQDNVLPPSTDFYVRFYMRNDDIGSPGDHVVVSGIYSWQNLTYMRKFSGLVGWTFVIAVYGCGYTYPIGFWGPAPTLRNGLWYRFEYYVHFVDPTHLQVHPRVYEASGNLIFSDADFRQTDFRSTFWNGSNTWTLASYYAAANSFCVDPTALTSFSMGNNGQGGALGTGLPWYYAGVQIRTDRWPGP